MAKKKKFGFSFLAKKSTNQVYWAVAVTLSIALFGFVGFTLYFIIQTLNIVFQPQVPIAEGLVRFDLEAASRVEKLPTPSAGATVETTASPLPSPVPMPLSTLSPSPEI